MKSARLKVRKHFFLVRLLILTLVVGMIPLILLSSQLMKSKSENIAYSEQSHIDSITMNVASMMSQYMRDIAQIQLKHQTQMLLMDDVLTRSAQSEINGVEFLSQLTSSCIFLQDSGIIRCSDKSNVYASGAKYDLKVYAMQKMNMTESNFLNILSSITEPVFLPWNGNVIVYIAPERPTRNNHSIRYGIYISNRSTLLNALGGLCADGVVLDRIMDHSGAIIYQDPYDIYNDSEIFSKVVLNTYGDQKADLVYQGNSVFCSAVRNDKGLMICMHKPQEELSRIYNEYGRTIRFIVFPALLMTLIGTAVVVLFVYKPIRKAVSNIPEEDLENDVNDEIDLLYSAFSRQKLQKSIVQKELAVQQNQNSERLFKWLMSGRTLTEEEKKQLAFNQPYFFLVATDRFDFLYDQPEIVGRLKKFGTTLVQMIIEQCDILIVWVERKEPDERSKILSEIFSGMDMGKLRIGVSGIASDIDDFHMAFIEASMALHIGKAESGIRFADGTDPSVFSILCTSSFDTMKLIQNLREGNKQAVDQVRLMFDQLELMSISQNLRKYLIFRILEYLRNVAKKADEEIPLNRLAEILCLPSEMMIRDEVCILVSDILNGKRAQKEEQKQMFLKEMIDYIQQNAGDNRFGLDLFANHFNILSSAASRLFKDVTGIKFSQYLLNYRLDCARNLLASTDLSVNEVAEKTGFSSSSYFIQVFKANEKVTPAAYRMKNRSER